MHSKWKTHQGESLQTTIKWKAFWQCRSKENIIFVKAENRIQIFNMIQVIMSWPVSTWSFLSALCICSTTITKSLRDKHRAHVWLSPHLTNRQTNICGRHPFEEFDGARDHAEYKATAYQRSKTSDNNPITYPPVILSCPNSTFTGGSCVLMLLKDIK